jgi:hypothetical protein
VELLGVDAVLAEQCLDELAQEEGVVMEYLPGPEGEVTAVYLVPFHRAEVPLANGLLRLLHAPVGPGPRVTLLGFTPPGQELRLMRTICPWPGRAL